MASQASPVSSMVWPSITLQPFSSDMGTGSPAYRLSKAALNALTVFLHAELSGSTEIHVNSICPGWVRTALGGPNASRSLEEGVQGILWIVNEEPELSGKFIRDRRTIDF